MTGSVKRWLIECSLRALADTRRRALPGREFDLQGRLPI